MGSALKGLAVLIVSIVITFSLAETAMRITGHKPLFVNPEQRMLWKHDALLGWAHRPGQIGAFETAEFVTHVRINSRGLRDGEHPYERTDARRRILVLGDSFAWGYGVEDADRFSEVLEASSGVETINAGVSGYSTDQELLWLKSEGIKYNADLVLLVYCNNDDEMNHLERVYYVYNKPRFVIEHGALALKGVPVPGPSLLRKAELGLQRHSAFYHLSRWALAARFSPENGETYAEPSGESRTGDPEKPFEITVALLHEIERAAKSSGAEFMIVATNMSSDRRIGEAYRRIVDTMKAEGFRTIDVQSCRGFDPGMMTYSVDGHWNKAGHGFVADTIWNYIRDGHLLDVPPAGPAVE